MKKRFILLSILFVWIGMVLHATVNDILPKPQSLIHNKCGNFTLNQPIQLKVPQQGDNEPAIETELQALIQQYGGSVVKNADKHIEVKIVSNIPHADFQQEAYRIDVCTSSISIQATTLRGAYWGVQTLWQMAENNDNSIASVEIVDWAAFRIRGYMHDIGRSYIQFDELKNEIKRLARFKINTFHWHLTDNQGWRLESKIYPQLNANTSYSRMPGKYYTIAQAQELVRFGKRHGVEIIPEIDMPGHSEAFRKAMGHVMLTDAGLQEMKNIMNEACNTFADTEWMHIGSDEVRGPDKNGATMNESTFVQQITDYIRSKGKKIVVWNPGHGYNESNIDMTQMWSSRGTTVGNKPTIDSRYHYINHYDQYADIVSLYNSTVAQQQKGSQQYAGLIIGIWNDRIVENDREIVMQNAFYPAMLAAAERAWRGGGKGYFTQIGTTLDPTDMDFIDWEKRFLHHKANFLKNEPIAYVKQSNIQWKITDPFPNGGNVNNVFPPETNLTDSYTYAGNTYHTKSATGAGIYLRHVWGTLIPTFYSNPIANSTAYAYTYVYSPTRQDVGMQIEFQNYGRSEADLPPPQGQWDYNNSKIWVNDTPINPPTWLNRHTQKNNETSLKNENFAARSVIPYTLNKGWNKVLIKLPNKGFSLGSVRLVKWMFTFAFTTTDGRNAVDGLVYSPHKNIYPALDLLKSIIEKANTFIKTTNIGEQPGQYSYKAITELKQEIDKAIQISVDNTLTNVEYQKAANTLSVQLEMFKKAINQPHVSDGNKTYWYSLSTPNRPNGGNNFVTFKGDNTALKGEPFSTTNNNQLWKFTRNTDGTLNIIPKSSPNSHIDSNAAYNSVLKAQAENNTAGWNVTHTANSMHFIITSNKVQLNQTGSGQAYQIYNWGGGNNTTDAGCQYLIKIEMTEGETAKDKLQKAIIIAYAKTLSVTIGEQPGMYSEKTINDFQKEIEVYDKILINPQSTDAEFVAATQALTQKTADFIKHINLPMLSTTNSTYWYAITAINRDNKSIRDEGVGQPLVGKDFNANDDAFLWKLEQNSNHKQVLINKATGNYIDPTAANNTAFVSTKTEPTTGWTFTPINNTLFTITDGQTQFNQTNAGLAHQIYNWGGGNNTTDKGCQFSIRLQKSNTTNVSTTMLSDVRIWIDSNGYLQSDIDLAELSVFTLSGFSISPYQSLPKGVILVSTPTNKVVKLIVR